MYNNILSEQNKRGVSEQEGEGEEEKQKIKKQKNTYKNIKLFNLFR